ncbi:hypothetical protein LJC56_06015 [Christensenellaceae bacterium OttesenSCG-928-K19]|nr:hypothetical protein [Christensenellaceae bacterium OttesenSCG-928-K19]
MKKNSGHNTTANDTLSAEELEHVAGGKTKTVGKEGYDFICTQCGAVYHDAHTRCKCGSLAFREEKRIRSGTSYI